MHDDYREEAGDHLPPPENSIQSFQHTSVAARVPAGVAPGVFSNAVMVLQCGDEFVLDFVSSTVPPQQVVARVVLTAPTFAQFISALRTNVKNYEGRFGTLAARPASPAPHSEAQGDSGPQSAPAAESVSQGPSDDHPPAAAAATPVNYADLYDQLKLPDELLGGAFANVVMIRHTSEEFVFDFATNFFPRSSVTARIFMAAGRVPGLLVTLSNSFRGYREKKK